MTEVIPLPSRRATRRLGARLASMLEPGDIIWLEGPLGAGKTFFARGLFRALGIPESIPITSPTFGLVHEYVGRAPIFHLDLYRLGSSDELDELGVLEALEEGIVVLEWGEGHEDALGRRGLRLRFERPLEGRAVRLEALDARGESLARGLLAR